MDKKKRMWIGMLACVIALLGSVFFYQMEKHKEHQAKVKKERKVERKKEVQKEVQKAVQKEEAEKREATEQTEKKAEIKEEKWSKEKAEEMVPLPDEEALLPKTEGGIASDEGVYEPDDVTIHERVELKRLLTEEEYQLFELTLRAFLEDQHEYRKSVYVTGVEPEEKDVTVYLTFQHVDISKPHRHIKCILHKELQRTEFAYVE